MKKKSFMVIGLGRFGLAIVKQLSEMTKDIIAVDVDESRVTLASQYVEQCFVCDCTKKKVLEELDVKDIDHVIVSIGDNLQASILITINLKELGVKRVTVRVDENEYIGVMERLGADEVLVPEDESGKQFAKQAISDSILDYYSVDKDYGVASVSVPEDFEKKTLAELNLRNTYDVSVVGITRDGKFFLPKGTDNLEPNDIVMVVGKTTKINKLDKFINK